LLNTLFTNLEPPAAGHVAGITRLMRRICLLREQGDAGQAARLHEHELADAVRELRATHGAQALSDEELRALFAAEEQRVAEAVVLAELLIPQLVGARPPVPAQAVPATPVPARLRVPAVPPGSPGIPDLLDAMLAAERNGRRPSPAASRES
jgi:hypothetical protein